VSPIRDVTANRQERKEDLSLDSSRKAINLRFVHLLAIPIVSSLHVNLIEASKAKALKDQYPEIELVQANLDDPASLDHAMTGAYGVYGVTNFWEHFYDGEIRQGKALVDAAKKSGIKHFVWSTLDHDEEILVPHFESKWHVDGVFSIEHFTDYRIFESERGSQNDFIHGLLY
jgi:NmrA-like family